MKIFLSSLQLKFQSILELAYLFDNIGEGIQAMIFAHITNNFINKLMHGIIANLHVLG